MSHFQLFHRDATPDAGTPHFVVSVAVTKTVEEDGETLLFPPCLTGDEIDEAIDRLITQLNAVRHKAKEQIAEKVRE